MVPGPFLSVWGCEIKPTSTAPDAYLLFLGLFPPLRYQVLQFPEANASVCLRPGSKWQVLEADVTAAIGFVTQLVPSQPVTATAEALPEAEEPLRTPQHKPACEWLTIGVWALHNPPGWIGICCSPDQPCREMGAAFPPEGGYCWLPSWSSPFQSLNLPLGAGGLHCFWVDLSHAEQAQALPICPCRELVSDGFSVGCSCHL